MKVTQLIGLGETQRKIYEHMEANGEINGNVRQAYQYHQKEIEMLIKYQKSHNEKT